MRLVSIIIILFLLMAGCEQSSKPLEGVQNEIVNNLTSSSWIHTVVEELPDGSTSESSETWIFQKTGKGSHKIRFQSKDGQVDERTYYFQWAFTTQNFSVICMDIQESGICYWLIEKLTSTQLDVIQALEDPVLHPEVEKDYLSFHSTI